MSTAEHPKKLAPPGPIIRLLVGDEVRFEHELARDARGRADREAEHADRMAEHADRMKERADRLADQLRALGIEPEA